MSLIHSHPHHTLLFFSLPAKYAQPFQERDIFKVHIIPGISPKSRNSMECASVSLRPS